jgi:hypothetical protein
MGGFWQKEGGLAPCRQEPARFPSLGSVVWDVTCSNPVIEPFKHFTFNPANTATRPIAEAHALWELSRVLESLDMLWTVQDQLFQLPFRYDPHRSDFLVLRKHRDAPWVDAHGQGEAIRKAGFWRDGS